MSETNADKRSLQVNGLRLSYLAEGEGAPVVFVHGWPTYSHLWRHQVNAVSQHFRVYALDLPGFGDSDKPTGVDFTLDFFAGILDGFLQALNIERVSLVCHDLGGPISLLWAVKHPEQLAALVIMDTTPYPDLPPMLRLMLPVARLPGLGRTLVSRFGLRCALWLGTARRGVVTDALVNAYDRPFAGDPAARRTLLRILTGLELEALGELARDLDRITAPTLILWAEKDPSAPLSIARRLKNDISGAVLKTISECGHFLTEDRPEEVNRLLVQFLRKEVESE